MVHPGGFEPPTARFVAEYSIQLSYGCIRRLLKLQNNVLLIILFGACDIVATRSSANDEQENGASRRIRTSDRSVRSRVLYPAELWMQNGGERGIRTLDAAFDRILP